MKKIFIFLFCLGLLSCLKDNQGANNTSPSPSAEGQNIDNIDQFMRQGPGFPLGDSLAEIRKNLGRPLRETVEDRQNVHDKNQTDQIYKLFYGGLYLEVYHVTEMNRDLILLLEVTGDQYQIAFGLAVGALKAKVRKVLGKPNDEKPTLWRYFASDLIMGAFEFGLQGDRAVSIKWYYSID
ncbi:MAG: hypothetical protein JXD23_05195 [Spirochaetales bacterium]|nr:hypothetical protein [Spirochaetales bacterium]